MDVLLIVSFSVGDDAAAVIENRSRLCHSVGHPLDSLQAVLTTEQVDIARAQTKNVLADGSSVAGMLALGLVANSLVKPLSDKWFMSDEEVAALQAKTKAATAGPTGSFGIGTGGFDGKALVAWAVVGIPILWGVWITLQKTFVLFG